MEASLHEEFLLVERAKQDPEAFGQLFDRYYGQIFGFLFRRIGERREAEDLTSETFFQALKNLHRFTPRGKPFRAWLFAIASARLGDYARARRRLIPVTLEEAPELVAPKSLEAHAPLLALEAAHEQQQTLQKMRQLLPQLSPIQQQVLHLRFFGGCTIPQIAEALEMKEGTIKSHLHRAIAHLRDLWEQTETEPGPSLTQEIPVQFVSLYETP